MSRERIDPAAVRAALSDPRAVARALGLERGAVNEGRDGLKIRCPAHGDRTPSMSLRRAADGTLSARCYACGWGGDVLALVAEVERLDVRRDFRAVLLRAAELTGGVVANPQPDIGHSRPEAPRLDDAIAAELFARVCARGRLGERGPVEAYLARRGLLEAARAEGWASLPSLRDLLDIARGMCQDGGSRHASAVCVGLRRQRDAHPDGEASGQAPGAFAFGGPEELLIAGRLARRDKAGRLRLLWGDHRLVIPWRGPDRRIQALQRRLIRDPRKPSEPRYVATWAPRWPYGVHRLCIGQDRLGGRDGSGIGDRFVERGIAEASERVQAARCAQPSGDLRAGGETTHQGSQRAFGGQDLASVAFVEGAVDALALGLISARAGRAGVVLGLPGTGAWESAWAGLARGRKVYFCHDGADENHAGDFAAARAAVACAEADGRIGEVAARAMRRELEEGERLTREARQGRGAMPTPRCVLCGAAALWLCAGCGRRRARGKDWGADWERGRG